MAGVGASVWKRLAMAAVIAGAGWAFGGPASASGDYSCGPTWTLDSPQLDCGSSLVISPGTDTRVNLALLVRDRGGLASKAGEYPKLDWDYSFGRNFVDWDIFANAAYGKAGYEENDYYGSRCVSLKGGDAGFTAAVGAAKLKPDEREKLIAARSQLAPICRSFGGGYYTSDNEETRSDAAPAWPANLDSKIGKDFVAYLVAAAAFYGGDWDAARKGFITAANSSDPWLKETAKYMQARVELNAAQAQSFDEWGSFELDKTDHIAAARAEQGFAAYLAAYPKGAYAASAKGLQRRVAWLKGDLSGLSDMYEAMLNAAQPGSLAEASLIEEVDNKLLPEEGAEKAIDTPLLLATYDLLRMRARDPEGGYSEYGPQPIDERELAQQEALFKGREELYQFLRANYSFYVGGNAQDVLQRIADNSVTPTHSALDFSRQILRGQALAAMKDPGEEAFWRRLIGGSTGIYQRPAAELGLALHWEKAGKVPSIFAADSPVQDSMIRKILIEKVASPDILRASAKNGARPKNERDLALFTLLYKQLTHGQYAAFGSDLKLVGAEANTEAGLWNLTGEEGVPVGLSTSGRFSDGYACPSLSATAAVLAKAPKDVKGRLCLGEFYRLNGFDDFYEFDAPETGNYGEPLPKGTLGSGKSLFPGTETPRAAIYSSIIADPAAAAPDKAYALYRAVRCYAPSGNNTCGGDEVPESQRKAWFNTLKKQYPTTKWAKDLQYYW